MGRAVPAICVIGGELYQLYLLQEKSCSSCTCSRRRAVQAVPVVGGELGKTKGEET